MEDLSCLQKRMYHCVHMENHLPVFSLRFNVRVSSCNEYFFVSLPVQCLASFQCLAVIVNLCQLVCLPCLSSLPLLLICGWRQFISSN